MSVVTCQICSRPLVKLIKIPSGRKKYVLVLMFLAPAVGKRVLQVDHPWCKKHCADGCQSMQEEGVRASQVVTPPGR